jgi:hypothetical protein
MFRNRLHVAALAPTVFMTSAGGTGRPGNHSASAVTFGAV